MENSRSTSVWVDACPVHSIPGMNVCMQKVICMCECMGGSECFWSDLLCRLVLVRGDIWGSVSPTVWSPGCCAINSI